MQIQNKQLTNALVILDDIIEEYKKESPDKKRDWRTYEQRLGERLRTAYGELKPLVQEAVQSLKIVRGETRGVSSKLTLEQKVLMLLLKHLIGKSNRDMSLMIVIFSWLTDIDISYKTVERLYSDNQVILALHNLHQLILKKKNSQKQTVAETPQDMHSL
jgi:hypothetical protein